MPSSCQCHATHPFHLKIYPPANFPYLFFLDPLFCFWRKSLEKVWKMLGMCMLARESVKGYVWELAAPIIFPFVGKSLCVVRSLRQFISHLHPNVALSVQYQCGIAIWFNCTFDSELNVAKPRQYEASDAMGWRTYIMDISCCLPCCLKHSVQNFPWNKK